MEETQETEYRFARFFIRPEGLFLLAAFVLMPLISGSALYQSGKSDLREELAELCESLLPMFPNDAYQRLAELASPAPELRNELMRPLSLIHRTNPKIQYIYTLRGEGDNWYFLLDTLQDPVTERVVSQRYPHSVASEWRETYEYPESFLDSVEVLLRGETWVDSEVFVDEYGSTIGCIVLLKNSAGTVDLLGVDYRADQLEKMQRAVTLGIIYGAVIGLILLIVSQLYLRSYMNVKQQLLEHLHLVSNTDVLTGIANRRWFFKGAEQLIKQRAGDAVVSAAVIDIDHFKVINDTYGHEAGDEALRVFSRLLDQYCNQRKFVIGRIGGEEFAVCCATNNQSDMIDSLNSLKLALAKVVIAAEQGDFSFTFSAGIVNSQDADMELPGLMRKADEAMYESKDTGRDRISVLTT